MGEPRVVLEVDGAVGAITLTGRGGGNAMDLAFVRELDDATAEVTRLAEAGGLTVVTVRARGRHFCVGGDLAEFQSVADLPAHLDRMTVHAHRSMARLHELPVPLVVGVHGATAGAGWGFVLAADVVLAAASASFRPAYAAAGLTPDAGVSWALPRRIGSARALEVVLANRRHPAAELVEWGLVTRVVDDELLGAELDQLVDALRALDPEVVRETKRLLHADDSLRDHLDDEARTIAAIATRAPAPPTLTIPAPQGDAS
ncbi:MAG: enoyl-CoA hydratase/isomerase family protein [Actinomycetales bacterium]|nr:MAG: enoyl-CoA hydratase/isomerase family protein [Actinomycetales bacterium]